MIQILFIFKQKSFSRSLYNGFNLEENVCKKKKEVYESTITCSQT